MLKCYEIPEAGRAARGTAIVNLLQLDGGEKVTAMIPIPDDSQERNLVMVTRNGLIKKTALEEFKNLRKAGPDRHHPARGGRADRRAADERPR